MEVAGLAWFEGSAYMTRNSGHRLILLLKASGECGWWGLGRVEFLYIIYEYWFTICLTSNTKIIYGFSAGKR